MAIPTITNFGGKQILNSNNHKLNYKPIISGGNDDEFIHELEKIAGQNNSQPKQVEPEIHFMEPIKGEVIETINVEQPFKREIETINLDLEPTQPIQRGGFIKEFSQWFSDLFYGESVEEESETNNETESSEFMEKLSNFFYGEPENYSD